VYQATKGVQVGEDCRLCSGVAVDKDKNVYMSESDRHRVVRWSPQTHQTTVVAGQTNTSGVTSDLLDHPQGIYVSGDGSAVYVADMWNSRIQRWNSNTRQGSTVAGSSSGTAGDAPDQLNYPNDVTIDDETGVIYVIDTSNNRVQRWKSFASVGETIAGGMGMGNATNQLNKPADLAFDMQGNLYVMDMDNNRVQMFDLIDNRSCSVQSSGTEIDQHCFPKRPLRFNF
jgi:DNA-binding beta-propeller fold protein YncE